MSQRPILHLKFPPAAGKDGMGNPCAPNPQGHDGSGALGGTASVSFSALAARAVGRILAESTADIAWFQSKTPI